MILAELEADLREAPALLPQDQEGAPPGVDDTFVPILAE
jgi:hypothetical protein